jgi:hypothetical protein
MSSHLNAGNQSSLRAKPKSPLLIKTNYANQIVMIIHKDHSQFKGGV